MLVICADHVPRPVLRPRGHRGAGRARALPENPLGGRTRVGPVPKRVQDLQKRVRTFRHFTFLEDRTGRRGVGGPGVGAGVGAAGRAGLFLGRRRG